MAETGVSLALRLPRSMDGLARLGEWVDEVVAQAHLGPAAEYALRLCTEEAVANIVFHGVAVPGHDCGEVMLRLTADDAVLRLFIEDACAAFDPLQAARPQPQTNLAEAREGGLGIHLMRQYAQGIEYATRDGHNILTVTIARNGKNRGP